jgi:hypothetical protein
MKKLASGLVALTLFAVVSNTRVVASPTSVTYTGSAPTNVKSEKGVILQASATFTVSNLDLIIMLSNVSTNAPLTSSDILTAIFFDLSPIVELTPVSATVAPGSKVIGPQYYGNNTIVSGQWAFRGDLTGKSSKNAPGEYGLSSTKFNFFNKKTNLFSDMSLYGTSPLNGAQFGLTDMSALATKAQGNIKNADLIQNTIELVLDGLPVNFSLADIGDVSFEFGTAINKGINIPGFLVGQIPEPSTAVLVAVGLVGALTLTRSSARRR